MVLSSYLDLDNVGDTDTVGPCLASARLHSVSFDQLAIPLTVVSSSIVANGILGTLPFISYVFLLLIWSFSW